jgi:hypothetical protein
MQLKKKYRHFLDQKKKAADWSEHSWRTDAWERLEVNCV